MVELEEIAWSLDQACVQRAPISQFSGNQPFDLQQAYAIQKQSMLLRYKRGEQLTGYKLGFTSKAKMQQMGVHELIWGHLTDAMDQTQSGQLQLSSFIHPRAEPEIAFQIGLEITQELDLHSVKDHVSGVAVAIEVIDSRYRNFQFSLEDVIADNCSSAAFAVGPWSSPDTPIDNLDIQLLLDQETAHQGNSRAIMGNPWESLVELTRLTTQNGLTIPSGFVVLAGAATAAAYIHEAKTVSAVAETLGSVSLTINQ